MTLRPAALALSALVLSAPALAEEGGGRRARSPEIASQLEARGFKVDAKSFASLSGSPMGAVVSLGGCSASFVSPDGLVVTNHHCGAARSSTTATPERDLLENGFLAKRRADELPTAREPRVRHGCR